MTKHILFVISALLMLPTAIRAQKNPENYDVVKLDTMSRPYRPGQVLVKFKDDSSISLKKAPGRMRASSANVQAVLNRFGVTNMEQLMPVAGKVKMKSSPRLVHANGKKIEDRDLTKL